jgi:carbonic anhydrase/acetyltransferase-like protein (isoleucine patch superfamily)
MAIYAYGERRPQIDDSAWIFPDATIIGDVHIGKGAYVGSGAILRGDYGTIIIEKGVAVEENTTFHASPRGTTLIKKNAIIGHMAMIHMCTIESEAVIGMSAVISNYATIGSGAIIGEGSVIKQHQEIPANTVAVGVPAKILGPVSEDLKAFWKEAGKIYRQLAIDYPKKLQLIT